MFVEILAAMLNFYIAIKYCFNWFYAIIIRYLNTRTTSDNKDAVKEDKQSKGDQKSDTNDRKHPQTGRQDSSQQAQETPPKVPRSGAVTRSRVVRKPKRDLSPPPSPTKKPGINLI